MARSHTIAVAGKGGVGKTTTCGMIIDYLCKAGKGRQNEKESKECGNTYIFWIQAV